jgi:hypothetical protein
VLIDESIATFVRPGNSPAHRLDAGKIVETAKNLAASIEARLPGTTLSGLAHDLARIAVAAEERVSIGHRPIYAIRLISVLAIVGITLPLIYVADHIHTKWEFGTITEVFEGVHAGFELLVILAGILWFCATLESRMKRNVALGFVEELREFVHVIDITQLYFTPDLYGTRAESKTGALHIDETYLLDCTQMLALIGNLVSLSARGVKGEQVLRAVSEVEMLTIAISTKHLTKFEAMRARNHRNEHDGK